MVSDDWKRNNAIIIWVILTISVPIIAMIIFGLFISWYNNYNPISFISSVFLEFVLSPFLFVILMLAILVLLTPNPIKYRISKNGIRVKFIGRKTKGLIPWSDIERFEILKISRIISIYRKSTNFPTLISYNLHDFEIIDKNIKKPVVFNRIDLPKEKVNKKKVDYNVIDNN